MKWPALGALFSAFVAALVVAFLDTDFGREIASRLEGPGRALVAAPVIVMCLVIFGASVMALVLPDQRQRLLNVSMVTAWLVVAWVVMAAVILAGLAYLVDRVES
jgi:cation transporter-like permease